MPGDRRSARAADGGAARKTLAREPLRMRHPVPRCAARRYRCISSSRSARKQNTPASSADGRRRSSANAGLTSMTEEEGTDAAARTEERNCISRCSGQEKAKGADSLSLALLARHTYGQVDTRTDEEISHHCTDSTHTFPPPVHSSNSLHASGTNVGYINGTSFKGRNRNRRRVCSRNEAGYDSMRAQPNPAIPNQSIFWIQKRCALV